VQHVQPVGEQQAQPPEQSAHESEALLNCAVQIPAWMPSLEQLAQHRPLLPTVPAAHATAFVNVCSAAFAAYKRAPNGTDQQTVAIVSLLAIPATCLVQARKVRGGKDKTAPRAHSMRGLMAEILKTAETALWDETASLLNHMYSSYPSIRPRTARSVLRESILCPRGRHRSN